MKSYFLLLFALLTASLGIAQMQKLKGADDLFIRQDLKSNKVQEVKAELKVNENYPGVPIAFNHYNESGKLLDSVDANGDKHMFTYEKKGKMSQYIFSSTDYRYEELAKGEPEFRQVKHFTYDKKGNLIQIIYSQMGDTTHTINMEYDKKKRLLSYHSFDETMAPAYMGYYSYTDFDSVAAYRDYTADSTLIYTIDYTYNDDREPIERIEVSPASQAGIHWKRTELKDGQVLTVHIDKSATSDDEGAELFREIRQELTVTHNEDGTTEKVWKQFLVDYPIGEAIDTPEAPLIDHWVSKYDKKGKLIELRILGDGTEPEQVGKPTFLENGLIDFITMQTTEGQRISTIDYSYQYH